MRLKGYDYSQPGFYYVTICTQDRVERFGDVQNGKMILNEAGEMVHAEWNGIPERYEHVVMDEYQIMPNHMHGILQIIFLENGGRQIIDPGNVGRVLCPSSMNRMNQLKHVIIMWMNPMRPFSMMEMKRLQMVRLMVIKPSQ